MKSARLLLAALCCATCAGAETFKHAATGIECPDELATFKRTAVRNFEEKEPGLGVACSYLLQNVLVANVYIYTGGRSDLPKDVGDPVMAAIRDQTLKEIEAGAAMRGDSARRSLAGILPVQTDKGPVEIMFNSFIITASGNARNSFVWIWPARKHLVKIRMDTLPNSAIDTKAFREFYEAVVRLAAE